MRPHKAKYPPWLPLPCRCGVTRQRKKKQKSHRMNGERGNLINLGGQCEIAVCQMVRIVLPPVQSIFIWLGFKATLGVVGHRSKSILPTK